MQAREVFETLLQRFGERSCELDFHNNFELIVAVILSARCTDKRVNIVTKDLFKHYKTPQDLANANFDELSKEIYSCGFYRNKATNLILMAKDLCERFSGIVPNNYQDLVSLAGVGRKTANVVLYVGFGVPAIAVDTHVFRVSNRLALVHAKTPLECELSLQKLIDKSSWGKFHHLLVLFGRYVCSSRSPACADCEFKKKCPYFSQKNCKNLIKSNKN
jgi:endonuclease III